MAAARKPRKDAGRARNGDGTWWTGPNGDQYHRFPYRDENNVPARMTVKGPTEKAARLERQAWERRNLVDGRLVTRGAGRKKALTTVEVVREYIENNPRGLRPKTVTKYSRSLVNLEKEFGGVRPEDIKVGRVRTWVLAGGPSRKDELNLLRAALNWAHGEAELIPKNRLGRGVVITPPEQKRAPVSMPEDAYERLLEVSAGTQRQLMWRLGCGAGLRREELWGLNWSGIDEEARTVTVTGKGNKTRTVPVLDSDLLEDLRAEREARGAGPNDPVFLSTQNKGERVGYSTIHEWWHRDLRRAGLEGTRFTPHTLRHTFATELVNHTAIGENGERVPIAVAQKWMGHTNPNTTARYVHSTPAAEALAAEAFAARKFGRRKNGGKTVTKTVRDDSATPQDPRDFAEE